MEISFTKFRVTLECPWKYKLMFVDGQKQPLSAPGSLGLSLHRAIERYLVEGPGELEELLDIYTRAFVQEGFADVEERMRWLAKGRRMLERWHREELARRTELVGVEREFSIPVGPHSARGMIDRIDRHPDGRVELIDYKTRPDEQRLETQDHLQLRFYALGAREGLGLKPSLLTVEYLVDGRRDTLEYDGAGEAELKARILETAERIEAGKFDPDRRHCPRCLYRKSCVYSAARD